MYLQKVLQGIPNLKGPVNISIFDFLVMPQGQTKPVRHGLLSQAGRFSSHLEILSNHWPSLPSCQWLCAVV